MDTLRPLGFFVAPTSTLYDDRLDTYSKLVLMALSQHASTHTGTAFPSQKLLAFECGCSDRRIRDAVHALEKLGILTTQERKLPMGGHAAIYTLHPEKLVRNVVPSVRNSLPEGSGTEVRMVPERGAAELESLELEPFEPETLPSPAAPVAEKTKTPLTLPKPKTRHDYPADFAEWWPHYPKNAGKFAAAREWSRLGADRPPLEALVLAADTYARSKKVREGFVLDAERWLKNRRWLDEPAKPSSALPGFDPVSYARS